MKTFEELLTLTNEDGQRFLKTWIKTGAELVEQMDSPSWIYAVINDKLVVSLPTPESGCKACFFGDRAYYNKFKKSQLLTIIINNKNAIKQNIN